MTYPKSAAPALRRPGEDPDVAAVCRQVAEKSDMRRSWHYRIARAFQDAELNLNATPCFYPPEWDMPLESLWHPLLKYVLRVDAVVRLPEERSPEAEKTFLNLDLSKDLFGRHVVTPCRPGHFDMRTDIPAVSWRGSVALLAEKAMDYETGSLFTT
ncbi:MAG: hypothetical protein PHX68_02505 [Alphaproteobacteria bacterium]|nr:hypothetical protein [Alphaproteobacteria bacterium]